VKNRGQPLNGDKIVLIQGLTPHFHGYEKDLSTITQPLLVVAGTKDETMIYCQYEPVISQYTSVQVKLLQGVTHMGLVVSPEVRPIIEEWLEGLGKQ